MATTRGLIEEALKGGDKLEDLVCLWRPNSRETWDNDDLPPTTHCHGTELPTREFSDGYGGVEGEECICFSPNYIYVHVQYDGSEWFSAVPRLPGMIHRKDRLPLLGGG